MCLAICDLGICVSCLLGSNLTTDVLVVGAAPCQAQLSLYAHVNFPQHYLLRLISSCVVCRVTCHWQLRKAMQVSLKDTL